MQDVDEILNAKAIMRSKKNLFNILVDKTVRTLIYIECVTRKNYDYDNKNYIKKIIYHVQGSLIDKWIFTISKTLLSRLSAF